MLSFQNKKPFNLHRRIVFGLILVVFLMFGFSFALVPLYDVFCKLTGLNGKTENRVIDVANTIDRSREITIQFMANQNGKSLGAFYPDKKFIKTHPGELTRMTFFAVNPTAQKVYTQAIPSVSPGKAAQYFHKTECFCFTRQELVPGEKKEMAVVFRIDPALPTEFHEITLSYTLFELRK